jgi:excisionase family DNA binding protein
MSADRMTTTEPAPVMFRISTVVKLTGLSRSVIYEQIRAGRLPTVKQGRATLVTATALADYVRLLEREARTG